jgi:hypothetical protein
MTTVVGVASGWRSGWFRAQLQLVILACFSLLSMFIRLELAVPGMGLLEGNGQLYNGKVAVAAQAAN